MKGTRIRWAEHTHNPFVGCTKISPGCDHCYAEVLTTRFGPSSSAFPAGFTPTFKPHKIVEVRKWAPSRVFCNSLSDPFHADFSDAQRDLVFDEYLHTSKHDYLILTKRTQLMARYFLGPSGWLQRRDLNHLPANMWIGTSIESDRYAFRARILATIPAWVHFLSCEPLLGPLPSLDLSNIQWVIVGGESGLGYRPMDHAWARDLRDRCHGSNTEDPQVAFYFKQSAAPRTEMGMELDGELIEEYPLPHPADRIPTDTRPIANLAIIGRYVGRHAHETPVTVGRLL